VSKRFFQGGIQQPKRQRTKPGIDNSENLIHLAQEFFGHKLALNFQSPTHLAKLGRQEEPHQERQATQILTVKLTLPAF
jgi:hypothetical protein